ncbi:MAG: TIGR02611 family protein [Mycobacteriales bacterium]
MPRSGGTLIADQDQRDDEPGLLDEVAHRLGFRDRLKKHPALALAWRIGVGVLGTLIVLLGLLLVPLPGPGWLIVFLGLGVLATEFAWAERLLDYGRAKLRAWLRWVGRQHLAVRVLISILTLAFVAGIVLLTLYLSGTGLPFVGG